MNNETINSDLTISGESARALLMKRYRILRQLGQGGMGSVWLAEDILLDGKLFAIKMLPSILVSNKRAYNQLKAEALVSMKLVHQNIVALRAFEENGNNPFLVMDYIEGETLDDLLERRGTKNSQEEVVRLLKPIAEALDYAHKEGVVHRDVKPSNVMIRKDGHPFILDFGIAREIQETMTRVTGKMSSGTLMYMSPEQLNGDSPKPTQDVYSFAAMVYECLTGDPPFCRGAIEDQIKNKSPDPLPSGISIGSAVMAGLAKSPQERPLNCVDVLSAEFSRKCKRPLTRLSRWFSLAAFLGLAAVVAAMVVCRFKSGPEENSPVENVPHFDNKPMPGSEPHPPSPVEQNEPLPQPAEALTSDETHDGAQVTPETIKSDAKQEEEVKREEEKEREEATPAPRKPDVTSSSAVTEVVTNAPAISIVTNQVIMPPRDSREVDLKEIISEANKYKNRLDGIDDSDGFKADKKRFYEELKTACDEAKRKNWELAATRFTNCVENSKVIINLDLERRNAKISMNAAFSVKEMAQELGAEKYAKSEWGEASERMDKAGGMFQSRRFADSGKEFDSAAEKYGASATKSKSVKKILDTLARDGFIPDEKNNPRPAGSRGVLPLRNGAHIEMVWCPPGFFMMGSISNRDASEMRHPVHITKGFWISKYEVSQDQWSAVKGGGWGGRKPQTDVSVEDCRWFCRQFPAKYGVSLPSEAQWEYACRAGTQTEYSLGRLSNGRKIDGNKANVNAFWGVKDVGSFKNYANHWGICDMHGNVREWCADIYKLYDTTEVIAADPLAVDKGYNGRHVVRGGHCREDEERCTCASRSAGKVDKYTGFRICCTSLP